MANGTDDEQSRATREQARTAIRHQLGQYTPGEIRGLNLHPEVNPNLPVNLAIRASEALKARDRAEAGQAATSTFPQQREGPGVVLARSGGGVQTGLVGVAGDEGSAATARSGGFQSPGVPSVDTNALIASAIEGRQQIEGRRAGVESRRSALIAELGNIRPTGRGVNPRAKAIEAELGQLHDQSQLLSGQERELHGNLALTTQSAFQNARLNHQVATQALSQKTAEQASEVFLRSTELLNKYKLGSPELHDAMVKLKDELPLGFASEAAKGHLGKIAAFHDAERDANEKRLATALFKNTGLSPEQFARLDPNTVRATNAAIVGSTPETIEKNRSEKGQNIAVDIDGQTHLFTRAMFNNLKSAFPPQEPQAARAAAAPSPTAAPTEDTGDVDAAIREGRIVASPQRTAQAKAEAPQVIASAGTPTPTGFGGGPGQAAAAPASQGLQISSEKEYNQLPAGSLYIDPKGVTRRKP